MRVNKPSIIARVVALTAPAILASSAGAYSTVTTSFQRGVNGYTSESDIQFTSNSGSNTTSGNTPGATGTQLFTDGYDGNGSTDQQVFLQFNNIIGSAAGQIPANAFIIDASLTLSTGTSGNSQSGGPFGVGAVLVPWTSSSTYNTLKPAGSDEDGLSAANGAITRAVGFFDDPKVLYGGTNALESPSTSASKGTNYHSYTANVASLVQGWASNTMPNYGFTIHAGNPRATTDGWQIKTSTNGTVAERPKLSVTYTTAPVQTATFQQGVNGYSGTTMAWLQDSGETTDGATFDHAFLDGWSTAPTEDGVSADDHALVKFDHIMQADGGSVPDHAVIVKAYLKVTTSNVSNAQTGEPYEVHQMLTNWGTGTTYTQFSDLGPRPGIHETTEFSANYGMIPNSNVYFDVTNAVTSWMNGAPNYGFDIRASEDPDDAFNNPNGTHDGWSIYFTGAADITTRPELLVSYFLHLPGDANDNGKIDADDFALTDRGFSKHFASPTWANGDFDYNGVVDAADYHILDLAYAQQGGVLSPAFLASREAQFGAAYVSSLLAAVPEPTSLSLLALGAATTLTRRRRSR